MLVLAKHNFLLSTWSFQGPQSRIQGLHLPVYIITLENQFIKNNSTLIQKTIKEAKEQAEITCLKCFILYLNNF